MRFNQTAENPTLPDERITKVPDEKTPSGAGERKMELDELFLSLSRKLDELALVKERFFELIGSSEKTELCADKSVSDRFLQMSTSQDELTEPVLTYRLSSLLDFLRQRYDFEDCGVFLLKDENTSLEKLVSSAATAGDQTLQEFEDEIELQWRKGDIARAVSEKRRVVLPAKSGGKFLIIPFRILDKKDGFWAARFRRVTLPKKKISVELPFWVELISSCIENSRLKESSLSPQEEKSYHIETEKLFTTAEISKAVVHEINNYLQVILGRTQLLRMNEKKPQKTPSGDSVLETIEKNANGVCSILKDFSDHLHRQFSWTAGAGEVNIQHILRSNLVFLKYILKPNRIKLELDLEDELPSVYGNPGELELVLLSLIWGLRDQLPSGGSIRMQASTEEEALCLNVCCASEEIQRDKHANFADLKTNHWFEVVSEILKRHQGELKFGEFDEREIHFSLIFPVTPERKASPKNLKELKSRS